ncbi:hypothetical protein ACIGCM_14135 [Pseudomonas sp. NPDC078700]|uniref:hypothetical protein n=1 Tax=Pseudomonas sp. NPDC078700 TaxID=3364424 RepID=UPI0037C816BF
MPVWRITYSHDERAESLEVESAEKPSVDEATQRVLKMAQQTLKTLPPKELPHENQTPAVQLLERYAITVTGISQE